jgi:hypothetical protein
MLKRTPKSKSDLVGEVRQNQKVARQKDTIRAILSNPIAKDMSISDFGNHMNVLAGVILQAQKAHTNEMLVSALDIDLKFKDAPHPEFIQQVYELVKDEKDPEGVSALLVKLIDHVNYQIKEVAFIERKISEVGVEELIKN